MTISLRNLQSRPIPTSAALAQVRSVAATALGVERGGVGFAFVDDRAMSGYHQRFMDDPATTDVLSFPASSGSAEADEVVPPDVISEADGYWGDIIICTDQAARQARHLGHPYDFELLVLAMHGTLHLLGLDHETDDGEMRRLERRLSARLLGRRLRPAVAGAATSDLRPTTDQPASLEAAAPSRGVPGAAKGKSGMVAFVGRPNAGKSTLLNHLVGDKVSIVSDKPQTTRHRIRGVLTEARGQIVFVDTPGVHRPHFRMNRRMMEMTRHALEDVDVVVLMIDISEPPGRGVEYVLGLCASVECPVVLVLNKVDRVAKEQLLPLIDRYQRAHEFAEIFPLSALDGDNCDALLTSLFDLLEPGESLFPEDVLTDRSLRFLAAELIREQLLHRTRDELPYTTAVIVDRWQEQETARGSSAIVIGATIYVDKNSQKGIVIGKGGSMLRNVGSAARRAISELVGSPVHLDLWVKVHSGWREQPRLLDELEIRSRD